MRKRVVVSLLLLSTVIVTGTLGYTLIEGWDLFDSFYMTIVTLTTIGYEEVHRLSRAGRVFNVFMIVYGVGVVAYTVNFIIRFILEGEIQDVLGRRSMKKKLKKTKDHYIVCGYGRMGHIICKELESNNIPFVVIEKEPVELDEDDETLIIAGDATIDDVLLSAGIASAKGLISVLSSDAHNLFVVLSARGLNAKLQIVARAGDEGAEQKLIRAGADRVMSPYHIGGLRIAHTILKPSVVDFIEFATKSGNIEVQMEEVAVAEGSRLAENTIEKAGIGRDLGIIIVAIKKGGDMKFNPTHKTEINAGDTLIALGETSKLKRLEEAACRA